MASTGRRVAALGAAVIAIAGLSTGCGGEQLAEELGGQVIDGEVDIENDSLTITDDEGNQFAAGGGTQIPDSWPDDVPLYPDGDLVLATSQTEGTAAALWEVTSSVHEAAGAYGDVLISQGFTLDQDATIAGAIVRTYSGELHSVKVTVANTAGTTNVNIAVVPK
jgi:hypothetical protein